MRKSIVYTLVACLLLAAMPYSVTADETEDIPTNAAATGIHDSLVAALTHADLVGALSGSGPFTVFAPTDQAFVDAGIDLANFNTPELNATLVDILQYHVLAGASVMSTDLTDGQTAGMLNGDSATFTVADGTVMIDEATVVTADVVASNGVIHVIDKVLTPPADLSDIPTTASETGIHTALVAALSQADLVGALQAEGPFTVFAPTDQAFSDAGIDLASFDTDEENAALATILLYHVYSGAVSAADVTDGLTVTMLNGQDTTFAVSSDGVMIEYATVTTADVMTSNGIIHVIDQVLIPPSLSDDDDDDDDEDAPTPEELLSITDTDENGGMSIDEFNAFMSDDDEGFPQSALDDFAEIFGNNDADESGELDLSELEQFIAEIDAYIIAMEEGPNDIPTVAQQTGIHESLVAALAAADLVTALQAEGPFTVFAPTDEAFANAGIDLESFDTEEELAALSNILLYHVVAGTTLSTDLADGANTVTTLNTDELTITVSDGAVTVGAEAAIVTIADVTASNGVIHVIDKVLMPPADPFEGIDCAATVGLTSNGYGFTPSVVRIDAGQTVCWSWTDASMGHNVKQVDGFESSTYVDGGVTSGQPATTVAFHHTFTENQTFYYGCEPHISMKMHGQVVVGDGGVQPAADTKDTEDAPGFVASSMMLAILGAVLFMSRRQNQ